MTTREETMVEPGAAGGEWPVFRGLIWREWLRMRLYIMPVLAAWLALVWVLLLAGHPAFILIFGMIYVLIGAAGFSAGDVMEGSEEFAFALPPTRSQQYLAKLVLGLGTTVAFTSLGVLSIGLDLPQHLWGIFVNSGFTQPFPHCDEPVLYGLAIALPAAAFGCVYAMSANAGTRGSVALSAFAGMLLAGAVMLGGFLAEMGLWDRVNGYVSVPLLLASTPMALLVGYGFYVRKEGVNRPTPVSGSRSSWVWVVIAVVAVLLLAFFWLYAWQAPRAEAPRPHTTSAPDAATPPEEVGIGVVPAKPDDHATKQSGEDVK